MSNPIGPQNVKTRVYILAQELGIPTAQVVKKCQSIGIPVKNHMSYVADSDLQVLRRALQEEKESKKEPLKEEVTTHGILIRKGVKPAAPPPSEKQIQPVKEEILPTGSFVEAPVETSDAGVVEKKKEMGISPPSKSIKEEPAHGPKILGRIDLHPKQPQSQLQPQPQIQKEPQIREQAQAPNQLQSQIQIQPPQQEVKAQVQIPEEIKKQKIEEKTAPVTLGRRFEVVKTETLPWEPKAKKPRKKKVAPGAKVKKTEITVPKASKRVIRIEGKIQLQELAKLMSIKATELLMKLLQLGVTGVNINSTLDVDTAKIVASDYNYEVEDVAVDEEGLIGAEVSPEEESCMVPRPPIVTVMGHVDHGKTTLLDAIRKTNVAGGEAGGITQRIGASVVKTEKGKIVFIDTPGHEAFTAMRARGAQVTDIVVLVVAANDGVQEQTKESINHAKAAGVPIIVAINKIDLPNANIDKIKTDLAELGLVSEEWGGDTLFAQVSALTGKGIDLLLDQILLQAEMLELKTNPSRGAHGIVIESRLDKARGPMATVIIRNGVLKTGDYVVAGTSQGRIRAMLGPDGETVTEADCGTPVEILGLDRVPNAGDPMDVITDIKKAQWIVESRTSKSAEDVTLLQKPDLLAKMGEGEANILNIIVKADAHGVMEAIRKAIEQLSSERIQINIIHSSVGGITESDVMLASASKAIIVGFNLRPTGKVKALAESENVKIILHTIIYQMLDELKEIAKGMITPVLEETLIGRAKVLKVFKISKIGNVAGCSVTEGRVERGSNVRLIRDSKLIWTGKIGSLHHYKDEVKEVVAGQECGIWLDGYQDVKEGDEIEAFLMQEKEVTI